MNIRLKRLQADYEAVRRLAHLHPRIRVEGVSGRPPDRYQLTLQVRSLRQQGEKVVIAKEHRLEVVLPRNYPRDAPVCRMLTPVFHPNIAPHAVCIGDHWSAAESLETMIQRVGEMLAFQSYNVKSPLNGLAAQWIDNNSEKLPIDREEFFIDLETAAPPEPDESATACANCGANVEGVEQCAAGHGLCADCVVHCEICGAIVCLSCGETQCLQCEGGVCPNCGVATPPGTARCSQGHANCTDCAVECDKCGKSLCVLCDEYPCQACA